MNLNLMLFSRPYPSKFFVNDKQHAYIVVATCILLQGYPWNMIISPDSCHCGTSAHVEFQSATATCNLGLELYYGGWLGPL